LQYELRTVDHNDVWNSTVRQYRQFVIAFTLPIQWRSRGVGQVGTCASGCSRSLGAHQHTYFIHSKTRF